MPRLTEKYWQAVKLLSRLQFTSPYFMHIAESRKKGTLYRWLTEDGYEWDGACWKKVKKQQ